MKFSFPDKLEHYGVLTSAQNWKIMSTPQKRVVRIMSMSAFDAHSRLTLYLKI